MRVTGSASFTFAIVLAPGASQEEHNDAIAAAASRLRTILAQKEMENVVFTVTPVDNISVDAHTGKFRLIVDAV